MELKKNQQKEKDEILFRIVNDFDPHLGTELMQRFQQAVLLKIDDGMKKEPRTVKDLATEAEACAAERKRRMK